ncbi:hypothetical protein L596_011506 [Steinernema carpocapsae]|uniref:Uncharacterized protein n=1 Tax=Steinernema carpocapsae TaxID=34508 RepID=A0A4U5NU40_STECR|nr:hypothetical protein L596_011506 [Steinernema carpocapsae]
MVTKLLLLLGVLVALAFGHAPCIDYSDVCVPTQALQRGCHCALIRRGQEVSARQTLRSMFGRRKRDAFDDIRFQILQQNGVDELNRFFSPTESQPVAVDNNVFARLNTQVYVSLMTVPRHLVQQVVDLQGSHLTLESRNQLLHCGHAKCEVVGQMQELSQPSSPTRQDRQFRVNRAVKYEISPKETLIAFASATSDFFLNKKLVEWQEKKCKRRWFRKRCWHETRRREDLRVFDDTTRNNWMNHVNHEMVGKFRINNANLLV